MRSACRKQSCSQVRWSFLCLDIISIGILPLKRDTLEQRFLPNGNRFLSAMILVMKPMWRGAQHYAGYPDHYLVTVYTPNAQRELARISYRMEWEDAFRRYLLELDAKKPVVICGDMNVAHQEIDLKNPKTNRGNAGFSDEERGKMTELLSSGFTDTFRYLHPDTTGAYSWWSYMFHAREKNAGWRIDYFLVSDRSALGSGKQILEPKLWEAITALWSLFGKNNIFYRFSIYG